MDKEIIIPLSVIVEKRDSDHIWGSAIYSAVGVILDTVELAPWTILIQEEQKIRYHAGTIDLVLHHKETDAYKFNIESAEPSLFIVMCEPDIEDEGEEYEEPMNILLISASPYEAQDYDDVSEIVDRIPIPEKLYDLIAAFINTHHKEEKFIKRKRDKVHHEKYKFGKEPIFKNQFRQK